MVEGEIYRDSKESLDHHQGIEASLLTTREISKVGAWLGNPQARVAKAKDVFEVNNGNLGD